MSGRNSNSFLLPYKPKRSSQTQKQSSSLDLTKFLKKFGEDNDNIDEIHKTNGNYQYFKKLQLMALIDQLKVKGGLEMKKLRELIDITESILTNQPNVLKIISPVYIVGDIHGQFFDLLNIFQQCGFPDKNQFLFLGDYVDRGLFCIEVITLLLVLKLKYPKNIHLLRGNHEGKIMTSNFNFKIQCQKKYGIDIYQRFLQLFCKLPLCAVVDQTYFAVHGGISPDITKIKQIEKINRFIDIHNKGVICDLMWSDPSQNTIVQWEPNAMRGCSYYYSKIQAKRFLKQNKIKMIIRGHEVQMDGYSYQKTNLDQKLTLTIFSAPNYCDTYKNKGAIAFVANNKISIQRFSQVAHPFILSNYMDLFEFSMPGLCQLVGKIFVHLLKNKRKSRKSSMFNDKVLDELNALKRIQLINQIIEKRRQENQQVLLQTCENDTTINQDLTLSLEFAYKFFIEKKVNDCQEMYPDNNVIQLRERKKTVKKNLKIYKVFGPKLQMKNNIIKKTISQQIEDMSTIEQQEC